MVRGGAKGGVGALCCAGDCLQRLAGLCPAHCSPISHAPTSHMHTHTRAIHPHPPPRFLLPVVLTGGASNLSGLSKRLYWEALTLIPSAFKPRILTASALERKFSSWIGASILSALGTFQQMWVSKAEYDEMGPNVVLEKCQ